LPEKIILYFYEAKRLFVNLLCGFLPSKQLRFRLRAWALFPSVKSNSVQIAVPENKFVNTEFVNIAFCFDERVVEQVKLSIGSLLRNAGSVCYNIYCVVDKSCRQSLKDELWNAVKKQNRCSSITFLEANSDFDQSLGWKTPAIYYRLMLPHLLPDLDKIIYADVDTIFHDSLVEVNRIDLGSYFLGGVKDIINVSSIWNREKSDFFKKLTKGEYINSGFLIMNLEELRAQNLYEKWLTMSRKNIVHQYPDQNILNYTCKERKIFLPLKYNFIPQIYARALLENVYSLKEYNEAIAQPVMIHYAGQAKQLLNNR
jgi:lipopolysaccharide biosynthesis glycosyltransferase